MQQLLSEEDVAAVNRLLAWQSAAKLAEDVEYVCAEQSVDDAGWRVTMWVHRTGGDVERFSADTRAPSFGSAVVQVLSVLPAPESLAHRDTHPAPPPSDVEASFTPLDQLIA